ncbi:MAG: OsmC family protein [Acidimicrobiia bacterium]
MSELHDILGADTRPPFFPIGNAAEIGLTAPENRLGIPVRTWVRALAGMQKEAFVVNGASGRAWRLVSDEGPYLAGYDRAPCPLCTFITGMVSSYMNAITSLAGARGIDIDDIELTLRNHYSMEGSALKGTMLGGAQQPQLAVQLAADADATDLYDLVAEAVTASPVNGLLRGVKQSLFTLSWNGDRIPVGEVQGLGGDCEADPDQRFSEVAIAELPVANDLMIKVKPADQVEGVPGGINTSLQESQSRTLLVQARCRLRPDGIKEIHENLFRPIGSEFRFLSEEAPGAGGQGRAPDAMTYLSAGIGFCFMTQFGRYASITKRRLDEYRIVQDTHFGPGAADPVETHVYLVTPEGEEFARKTLDIGERTCFLHATCRTDLDMAIAVATPD